MVYVTFELMERHEHESMHSMTGTENVNRNKSLVADTSNLKYCIDRSLIQKMN